jgi:hypothetical protein
MKKVREGYTDSTTAGREKEHLFVRRFPGFARSSF